MVYSITLLIHSYLRWLVLVSLLAVLASAYAGLWRPRPYRPTDQLLRVVATFIAHTQLLVGTYLYTISPIIRYYWQYRPSFSKAPQFSFFGLIHLSLMLTAVILITIGSSKAKRQTDAQQQLKTTAIYFTIGLLLILLAVPWPFSPLANRPWFRPF
ncbi:hypothetical protein [Fibrella forsythiae]|uniref:Cytochrome B n=1 Tax=Fibrella forsythiae TaxID=2817061 RepID=A0ABS3JF66_9BACT|nr:hypothetical protein [Fibrella forsythiae]MBO0948633.1 hypothetical protein [Fibrella forsythiae]